MKGDETDFMGFISVIALMTRAWLPASELGEQVGLIPYLGLAVPEGN